MALTVFFRKAPEINPHPGICDESLLISTCVKWNVSQQKSNRVTLVGQCSLSITLMKSEFVEFCAAFQNSVQWFLCLVVGAFCDVSCLYLPETGHKAAAYSLKII